MIIKYKNSDNIEIVLNKKPYKVLTSDLMDYEWETVEHCNRIVRLSRGIVEKELDIDIISYSNEAAQEYKNKLNEIFEKDICNNIPGKIYIDDCYMVCFIKSCKKIRRGSGAITSCEYNIVTDYPFWIKENNFQYLPESPISGGGSVLTGNIMFPEFAFDFYPVRGEEILENPSFTDSNFIMTIYGFAESPQITIAGHPYRAECTIYEGERLVIDSLAHTVKKIGRLGEVTNLYNVRDKYYSVFKKIPPGTNTFQWSGGFGVDITLFEERSEPKWSF